MCRIPPVVFPCAAHDLYTHPLPNRDGAGSFLYTWDVSVAASSG